MRAIRLAGALLALSAMAGDALAGSSLPPPPPSLLMGTTTARVARTGAAPLTTWFDETITNPRPQWTDGAQYYDATGAVTNLSYPERVLSDGGLQSYWRFGDAYQDAAADVAVAPASIVDQKGNTPLSAVGTWATTPFAGYMAQGLLTGDSDPAIALDGGSYAQAGNTTALQVAYNTQLKITGLLKPNITRSGSSTYVICSKVDTANSNIGWELEIFYTASVAALKFTIINNGTTARIVSTSSIDIPNGSITHFAVTYTGVTTDANAGVKFYVNGVKDASPALNNNTLGTASSSSSVAFTVGARPDGTLKYTGSIDELAISTGDLGTDNIGNAQLEYETIAYLRALSSGNAQLPRINGAVNLVIDDDMLTDPDAAFEMATAHSLANTGAVNLLATTVNSSNAYSAAAMQALNIYSGRPNLPVGAYQGSATPGTSTITQPIATFEGLGSKDRTQFPTALSVLRTALASNSSVVICASGFLNNIADLLRSPADGISPLTGLQLVQRSVAKLVFEGATPNSGSPTYNLLNDVADAQYVFTNWPSTVPIVLMPDDSALKVLSGPPQNASAVTNIFAYVAQTLAPASLTAGRRNSWGPMTILLSGIGGGGIWNYGALGGTGTVGNDGSFTWSASSGNVSIMRPRLTNAANGHLLDKIMSPM